MPTPKRIPTDLSTILIAVRDKLISDDLFPSTAVWLSLSPNLLQNPPSDDFAVLMPGTQRVIQGEVVGGGRDLTGMEGEVSLTIWDRLALDQVPRADDFLTHSLGILGKMKCVINSLQLCDPVDASSNPILA